MLLKWCTTSSRGTPNKNIERDQEGLQSTLGKDLPNLNNNIIPASPISIWEAGVVLDIQDIIELLGNIKVFYPYSRTLARYPSTLELEVTLVLAL